jgi:hypothetical protein
MGYINKIFSPGEKKLLKVKLHPALWMLPIAQNILMITVIVLAVGGAFAFGNTDTPALGMIGLAVALVAAVNSLIWIFLIPNHLMAYLGLEMAITNQRIIRNIDGIFIRHSR